MAVPNKNTVLTPAVKITGLTYRRPGLNNIKFTASYPGRPGRPGYWRRGTVVYDLTNCKFLTHLSDVDLLLAVCKSLQTYRYQQVEHK